jgi:hypothetical protein
LHKAGISLGLFLIFSCAANAENALSTPPGLLFRSRASCVRNVRLFARESMRMWVPTACCCRAIQRTRPTAAMTATHHCVSRPAAGTLCRWRSSMNSPLLITNPTPICTHMGLIVTPTPDKPGPAGDYIFLQVSPGETENYRILIRKSSLIHQGSIGFSSPPYVRAWPSAGRRRRPTLGRQPATCGVS